MTDLTEKCKKGELPEGWYYLKVNEELANHPVIAECVIDYALGLPSSYFYDFDEAKIEQVLAPVPSYKEWQALIDLYKEADVIIKKSDKENTKLKTDCKTIAQKLLQVKPELRGWLEVNYGEYL